LIYIGLEIRLYYGLLVAGIGVSMFMRSL